MKSIISISLSVSLLFLLAVSSVSAHGDEDSTGPDNIVSDNMMNMDHNGFEGYSDHMRIDGEIQITDSVKLTISVQPTEEMNDMMNDHMGSSSDMMMYSNMMTISLTKLVEFEDLTDNGYSEDDIQVSEFIMDQTTMNPVELQSDSDISNFSITSKSNVINITVDILSDSDSPFAFKWSLDINYPFQQNNTKIAILHEMDSIQMADMMEDEDHMGEQGFDSNMMMDNDENLPMFFSWDEQYIVDGETRDVIPNLENSLFSLSFDQGAEILYDPQIGFNPEDIRDVDSMLDNIGLEQFWETVKTPTSLGIILGLLSLGVLFATSRFVKSNKK
ncbi:MAG: hypothetical protein GPJ54_16005 [Candidatus Heimdallarchaeota archaeon]|nr:hypothetical protein [Candidatus Heimdallarchaeota archaeon]